MHTVPCAGKNPMAYNNLSRGRHSVIVRGRCAGQRTYKRTRVQFRVRRGSQL